MTRVSDDEPFTLHNIEWVIGVRYAHRVAGPLSLFVDGEAHWERFKIDHPDAASGDEDPHSTGGLGAHGGMLLQLGAVVFVGASVAGATTTFA